MTVVALNLILQMLLLDKSPQHGVTLMYKYEEVFMARASGNKLPLRSTKLSKSEVLRRCVDWISAAELELDQGVSKRQS